MTGKPRQSHLDESGHARMVDVSGKEASVRVATAAATVAMQPRTLDIVVQGGGSLKGDALAVARVAGIMAAKKTAELIPLCHPVFLSHVQVDLQPGPKGIEISSEVKTSAQTGVEMEALVAVSVAALTLYDMCKSLDKSISIQDVHLVAKSGGKSGDWSRDD